MLLRISIKIFGIFSLILFAFTAHATNYYLSNSGNDSNSGTDPSAPWQTLNKLNSFKNLKPGDNVLFKKGDTFYGSITINNSGTVGNPITFSAYGAGPNPVITGFTTVDQWTNKGGNIWESTDPVSAISTCNMVVIKGVNTPMGRWPNTGYLTFQSHSGKTSITSNDLTGIPDWTGAEVVIRSTQWTLERKNIVSQSGRRLTYQPMNYEPANGFGFFIQNDIRTLDQQDEWYYNPSTKKLSIYSMSKPASVYLASKDTLVIVHGSCVTFNNLSFQGANQYAFYNDWTGINNLSIGSCSISYSGIDAIKLAGTSNVRITNSKISNSNNVAINLFYLNPSATIKNNYIVNTGIFCGMGESISGSYSAIFSNDKGSTIQNNKIINAGYDGIFAVGDSFLIVNNYIDTFCTILQDGGGIYTHSQQGINFGRKIISNIVLNGIGAVSGTNDSTRFAANGIYLDDNSAYIEVSGNSVAGCSNNGLFIHNGYNLNIHHNTFYNCSAQFATQNDPNQHTLRGSAFNNNIFFSKTIKQFCGYFASTANDFSLWGEADNNFYAQPIADSLVFKTQINWGDPYLLTLEAWKSYSGLDQNSKKSPKEITDTSDLRFEINADSISKTILLDFNYIDVTGRSYSGSLMLAPYSSIVLIKTGPVDIRPLTIDAGVDQSIILPQNSLELSGSAGNDDAKIVNYYWTKISGPSNYKIANAQSPITGVTGLIEGVYEFELKVTDNNGATAKDTVTITVTPQQNIPPTLNAGPDQTIMLPVNSTILTGSATDSDGYISNYLWEKISGPSNYNIENPNSAATNVSGLTEGVYQFQLTVKDDKGASASSMVQISVNPPLNIAPTANSGADQTITLPTNTATINGHAVDADGVIAAYFWTKISGPSAYNISDPSSGVTTVSGLAQGVYQFELRVTDDKGAVGKDSVQIIVNAAPNIPPVANAGSDKTITLPTNEVSLAGSGGDFDGTISYYSWTKISGPTSYNIANSTSATTTVSGLVQGIYQFELKVTDSNGATAKDTVQITVNVVPNIPPTANAGGNQTVTLPINTLALNGSGTDSDGTISSYLWTKISGPNAVIISNPSTAATTVNGLIQGIYVFKLTVTDNEGAVGTDTIRITVNPAPNIPPTAKAGVNQTITLPANTISLSGNGGDADGTIVGYSWTKISGPTVYNISNPTSATTTVSELIQGVYQFELKVTDNNGAVSKDTIQITVNPAENIPPIANAGSDKTITLPTNEVSLPGSGVDFDGTISYYSWTKISGPLAYNISNSSSAVTTLSGLTQGVYQFELKVTDDRGATGTDTIQVTVNPAANIPPTAKAGVNQTVTLPINTIALNGSGTDSDGTISSYLWTKISGPNAVTITNPSTAATTVNGLIQGIYVFKLTVTDNEGAIGTDTIHVTVNPAPNIPPIAKAGANQTITLPANTISLIGSGIDLDGTISSYLWTKISGPATGTITDSSSPVTTAKGVIQGIYVFKLTVTDNEGAVGTDTIHVTVNPAPNIPPTAKAGVNQTITLPVNTVALNGSGTDSDGTISSYLWTKISGPNAVTITNPSTAATSVKGFIQGIYVFKLTVTDNEGAVGTDTIQVTVNPAPNIPPTAKAGVNQTITLPVNTIALNGSGIDSDGTISSYLWTKISGPAMGTITDSSSPVTTAKGLIQGIYLFKLTVTDNEGAVGTDTIHVTVNPAANIPPTAKAGINQTVTLPVNTIALNGSGIDSDGTISSYLWTKISGPAMGTITDSSAAATTVKGLISGNYVFQLIVTDNKGAKGRDTVCVTVNAAKNSGPTADAGGDLTIALPLNTVYLNGYATDPNGTITAYQWKQVAGPDSASIITDNKASSLVKNLVAGTYDFELTVTDNNGETGRDTVRVVVALERISAEPNSMKIYPNPVHDVATVEITSEKINSQLTLIISDFTGKIIYRKQISPSDYKTTEKINTTGFSKGNYAVIVFFDEKDKQVMTMIKQ